MYESTRGRIAEIIGEASMLWTETPNGTFKSEKAKELVDEVMGHIEHPLQHPDDMNTALNDSKRFRIKEDELYKNDLCICKHERKDHRKSRSINFTEGGCGLCECKNFMMSAGQSNNSL